MRPKFSRKFNKITHFYKSRIESESFLWKSNIKPCYNRYFNKGSARQRFFKIYIKSIFNWSKSIKVNFHQKFQFSLENYKKFWPNPEKVGKFWPFLTIFSKRSEILTKSEILTTMAAMVINLLKVQRLYKTTKIARIVI